VTERRNVPNVERAITQYSSTASLEPARNMSELSGLLPRHYAWSTTQIAKLLD
jgi:hypothetical protein